MLILFSYLLYNVQSKLINHEYTYYKVFQIRFIFYITQSKLFVCQYVKIAIILLAV